MQITLKFYCKSYKKSNLSMSEFICEGKSVRKTDKKTDKRSLASAKCSMACRLYYLNSSVKKNIFKLVIKRFSK